MESLRGRTDNRGKRSMSVTGCVPGVGAAIIVAVSVSTGCFGPTGVRTVGAVDRIKNVTIALINVSLRAPIPRMAG